MRQWFAIGLLVLLSAGCSQQPAAPLLPGDVVRPQINVAPKGPWTAGTRVTIGMLLEIHRTGREVAFLGDKDVPANQAVMRAKVTFLDGDVPLGEPMEVPFVHDC